MDPYRTDVLVVGGGGAGLRAAIEAERTGATVLLVSKVPLGYASSTAYAGGGFRAAVRGLSIQRHFEETVVGGNFVNDQRLVEVLVNEAPFRLTELEEFGVKPQASPIGLSVHGPFLMNGLGLTKPLAETAESIGVRIMEGVTVVDIVLSGGRVVGALGVDRRTGALKTFEALSVILATGGLGRIYSRTDNPVGTTGDGYALAYRAGASLLDMEFIQFFPFGLTEPGLPTHMVDPSLVNIGLLRNRLGEDFLGKHGLTVGDYLRARDAMSRIIVLEVNEGRGEMDGVLLDLSDISEDVWARNPGPAQIRRHWLRKFDLGRPLHIAPLVHFSMGGVAINERCETNVPGLYAVGEVVGGIHGSNRLGGNALTETIVFGARAGRFAAEYAAKVDRVSVDESLTPGRLEEITTFRSNNPSRKMNPKEVKKKLGELMWRDVGVLRSEQGLNRALGDTQLMQEELDQVFAVSPVELVAALELRNMVLVAEMVARSALYREESRGAHYRKDFPSQDDHRWLRNVMVIPEKWEMRLETRPSVFTRLRP